MTPYLDTWVRSSTSRRAGIPSSCSARENARAQLLEKGVSGEIQIVLVDILEHFKLRHCLISLCGIM